ncbi:MAG: AAA family ATPase [Thaumarchaeota archaeon]|nr:AAA family ATPase [Nitrososphaerota archaeon]
MWSEKYRPKSLLEMIGNEEAKESFVKWVANWTRGAKPILLVGPPGVGKTTMALLVAKQFGYDLVSLNASDVRNKQRLEEILNPALGNLGLLGKIMIFVDEVDGIHGRADFGGVSALLQILKEPTVPIVLAANSESSDKMKDIRKASVTIRMMPIPPRLLRLYLESILQKEGESLRVGTLIKLVLDSRGDIRSMLNSAQALVGGFEPQTEKSFETTDVESAVNAFFKARSRDEAMAILFSLRMDPQEKINAFYSSIITSHLSKNDMSEMLDIVSEADILYGRIMREQQWRLLRYLDSILVKLYRKDAAVRYSQYNLPWPLITRLRWDGKAIKDLETALSRRMHVSRSSFATFYLPYLLRCVKNKTLEMDLDPAQTEVIQKELSSAK